MVVVYESKTDYNQLNQLYGIKGDFA